MKNWAKQLSCFIGLVTIFTQADLTYNLNVVSPSAYKAPYLLSFCSFAKTNILFLWINLNTAQNQGKIMCSEILISNGY